MGLWLAPIVYMPYSSACIINLNAANVDGYVIVCNRHRYIVRQMAAIVCQRATVVRQMVV
jgi:hypothetical protein